jgi:hypothetical protein
MIDTQFLTRLQLVEMHVQGVGTLSPNLELGDHHEA